MRVEVKIEGMDGVLDLLKSLPPEIVSKRGGPVKTSLAKGARFLRDRAKERLRAAIAVNGDESSGLLLENVVATRGKPPLGSSGERYLVRVRRKVYPRTIRKRTQITTTRKTAALLEYGSSHQPATPWLQPAVRAHGQEVISIVTTDLQRKIELTVRRLRRQGRL